MSISPQVSAGEATGTLTFWVYSTGCAAAGEVAYATMFGTASPADLELPSGRLRWAAGDGQTRPITARLRSDSLGEPPIEDFTVELTAKTPTVRVAVTTGHGRILDDDGSPLRLVVDDALCPKGILYQYKECACQGMLKDPLACSVVELSAVEGAAPPVTVRWSTVDDTARAGIDFVPVVDRLTTVPAGASDVVLPVQLLSTPPDTPTRRFQIQISASSPWQVADGVAVVTILGS